ncbi:MAG: RHS repeat protein [Pyrinomonadaceae bacterium]|nr:RHS repeat protein [Pyrinomonadaceae bacterium]
MKNTFKNILLIFGLIIVLVLSASAQSGTTQYVYDENGRLKAVIAPNGETTVYEYDAAGNNISIVRQNNPIVSINSITFNRQDCASATISSVAISGSGFIPDLTQNSVTFNGFAATLTSATENEIIVSVPVDFSSGTVRVSNANGTAEKQLSLPLPGSILPNSAPQNFSIVNGSQPVSLCFEGTINKNISILLENANLTSLNVKVSSPSGNLLISQTYSVANGRIFIDRTQLFESGTYFVSLSTNGNQTGNFDFSLFEFEDVSVSLPSDGTPASASISYPGQYARLQFSGTGASYRLSAPSLTIDDYTISLVRNSDGQLIYPINSLPEVLHGLTGDFTLIFDPSEAATGGVSLSLEPLTIPTDGTPVRVDLFRRDETAGLTFSANAGQNFTLQVSNATARPSTVSIIKPDGSILTSDFIDIFFSGTFFQFSTPVDGVYTIRFAPLFGAIGSATFSLNLLNEVGGTLVINDPPATFNSNLPGQPFRIIFAGNQGQRFNLKAATTDFYSFTLTITKPSGSQLLALSNFDENAVIDVNNLPETGNYTIYLQPNFPNQFGSITLRGLDANIFISNTQFEYIHTYFNSLIQAGFQNGINTEKKVSVKQKGEKNNTMPQTSNLAVPSASYFYNGTMDEQFSFSPNQIQTTFSFTGGTITLYNPDGTALISAPINAGICNVTLPESGTYRIEVAPDGEVQDLIFLKTCIGGPGSQ